MVLAGGRDTPANDATFDDTVAAVEWIDLADTGSGWRLSWFTLGAWHRC